MQLQTFLVLLLLITSCSGTRSIPASSNETKEVELLARDSLSLVVEAINLSEDMSSLSSKNDELLILIYELKDSLELNRYVFSEQLKLDEQTRSKKLWFGTSTGLANSKLLFLLIEQDSDTPVEQIDPIIRVYYPQIIDAFEARNYLEIEKYLCDEDLLGVKLISELDVVSSMSFMFSGIHKLDKYEYLISIGE